MITFDAGRRVRRSQVCWVVAQLLLGVGIARPAPAVVAVAAVGLVVLAFVEPAVRMITAVFALVIVVVAVLPMVWPLPALIAGIGLLVRSRPARHRTRWPHWLLGIGAGLVAAAVVIPLVLSAVDAAPLAFLVQRPPVLALGAVVVGAAVLNAVAEETLWRGSIVETDRRLGFPTWSTVALQAIGFGIAHWHGIPGGPVGVLAAAAFGAAMAGVRFRAGLRAALLAHVLTDVAIFSIVAATAIYLPT